MDFIQLSNKLIKQGHTPSSIDPSQRILAIDPGHTTGIAVFDGRNLNFHRQITTSTVPQSVIAIQQLLEEWDPYYVVIEEYRIYSGRQQHHTGSDVWTARLIGIIEALVFLNNSHVGIFKRMASDVKKFCTDEKLEEWNMYIPGQRHARDAIRHGAYFILFGPPPKKTKSASHGVG